MPVGGAVGAFLFEKWVAGGPFETKENIETLYVDQVEPLQEAVSANDKNVKTKCNTDRRLAIFKERDICIGFKFFPLITSGKIYLVASLNLLT